MYYYVQVAIPLESHEQFDSTAMSEFHSTGIEDFSLDEPTVDKILGEKSYSGADIPRSEIINVEKVYRSQNSIKKYYFGSRKDATNFISFLNSANIRGAHLLEQPEKDWNEEWKKNFSAIDVDANLRIVPAWEKGEDVKENELFIYPGMGFGTGSHETTYLCLKKLCELNRTVKRCFDYGCGSGILGLATKKFNPKAEVHLYDIDQQALDNCKQNIELNEMSQEGIRLFLPDTLEDSAPFDLVFANILQNILLLEKHKIYAKVAAGGDLILSGLLRGQDEEVVESYEQSFLDLKLVAREYKGDWSAVHFKKLL